MKGIGLLNQAYYEFCRVTSLINLEHEVQKLHVNVYSEYENIPFYL